MNGGAHQSLLIFNSGPSERQAIIGPENREEQIAEWNATIADVREHGTTHERLERERTHLIDTRAQPSFRLQARAARIAAAN